VTPSHFERRSGLPAYRTLASGRRPNPFDRSATSRLDSFRGLEVAFSHPIIDAFWPRCLIRNQRVVITVVVTSSILARSAGISSPCWAVPRLSSNRGLIEQYTLLPQVAIRSNRDVNARYGIIIVADVADLIRTGIAWHP